MLLLPFLLFAGCNRQTLLIVDPYIVDLFPETFSRRAIIRQQLRHRQNIDLISLPQGSLLNDFVSPLLADEQYTAVITTPLYAPYIESLAGTYSAISFWTLVTVSSPSERILPNFHGVVFSGETAMEQVADYLAEEYAEFDAEFLFLFNPRNDQDYAASTHLEEALIERQLKFDLQRFNVVDEVELLSYTELINSGQYDVTGLFLKRYNQLMFNGIEPEKTAIITEHIGNVERYTALPEIVASVEYDYKRGINKILSAIRRDATDDAQQLDIDADLIFYK